MPGTPAQGQQGHVAGVNRLAESVSGIMLAGDTGSADGIVRFKQGTDTV